MKIIVIFITILSFFDCIHSNKGWLSSRMTLFQPTPSCATTTDTTPVSWKAKAASAFAVRRTAARIGIRPRHSVSPFFSANRIDKFIKIKIKTKKYFILFNSFKIK